MRRLKTTTFHRKRKAKAKTVAAIISRTPRIKKQEVVDFEEDVDLQVSRKQFTMPPTFDDAPEASRMGRSESVRPKKAESKKKVVAIEGRGQDKEQLHTQAPVDVKRPAKTSEVGRSHSGRASRSRSLTS